LAETILGEIWYRGKRKVLVHVTSSGPSSYASGGFNVTVNSLRWVEKVIMASNDGGYKVEPGDISIGTGANRNVLTVPVKYYDYDAGADGAAIEVAAGTDLSAVTFSFIVIGA